MILKKVNGFFIGHFWVKFTVMKYVFTGPESSGKTSLATYSAERLGGTYVSEFAREYIENLKRPYEKEDLLVIAKEQFRLQELAKKKDGNLFLDTDLLTIKIWSEEKYRECDSWVFEKLEANNDFLYVLCKPDFPWQFDPQREHPNDQSRLFVEYENQLNRLNMNYVIAEGSIEERFKMITSL